MSFEIGVVHRSRPHLLADLAELMLVVRYDNLDQLSQAKLELIAKELPGAADEDDPTEEDEHSLDKKESSDRFIEDCWLQLEFRQTVFGDFYPFQVVGSQLEWKTGVRSEKQCLYAFLLVCSRLRSFKVKGFPQKAARIFTEVSREALQTLSGNEAIVRVFDAHSNDRRAHYGTNLRIAIKKLAEDIGSHYFNETEVAKLSSSGDYGLDLVSVHQFSDGASGSYTIFGQCGAQETEWPEKTLEAHPIKFQGLFTLLNQPDNLMFIPLSYRDSSGGWVAGHKLAGCLLIDRLRIIQLIDKRWDAASIAFNPICHPLLAEVIPSAA